MAENNKTFVKGSAKSRTFNNSDGSSATVIYQSMNYAQLADFVDSKGYVQIETRERREPDQYDNTHFMQFSPPKDKAAKAAPKRDVVQASTQMTGADEDVLPF